MIFWVKRLTPGAGFHLVILGSHGRCWMKIERKGIALILAVSWMVTFVGPNIALVAEPKTIGKYPIPDHGVLELNVPTSWKTKIHKPQENMPPTMIFSPAKGNDFQVTMMVLWGKKEEPGFNRPEKVETLLAKDGQQLLSRTVETKIVLKEIKGVNHIGYYFSITDKNPEPGEYRYMTRAGIGVGNLLLHVTVLHRVKESGAVKETLSMLREAKQTAK